MNTRVMQKSDFYSMVDALPDDLVAFDAEGSGRDNVGHVCVGLGPIAKDAGNDRAFRRDVC